MASAAFTINVTQDTGGVLGLVCAVPEERASLVLNARCLLLMRNIFKTWRSSFMRQWDLVTKCHPAVRMNCTWAATCWKRLQQSLDTNMSDRDYPADPSDIHSTEMVRIFETRKLLFNVLLWKYDKYKRDFLTKQYLQCTQLALSDESAFGHLLEHFMILAQLVFKFVDQLETKHTHCHCVSKWA